MNLLNHKLNFFNFIHFYLNLFFGIYLLFFDNFLFLVYLDLYFFKTIRILYLFLLQ